MDAGARRTIAGHPHRTTMAEHVGVTADDRWLVTLPLFHGKAQYYCLMSRS